MAESVDALVSNTSGATHLGSSPSPGTEKRILDLRVLFFYPRFSDLFGLLIAKFKHLVIRIGQ